MTIPKILSCKQGCRRKILTTAASIQKGMLPSDFPRRCEVDIFAAMQSAKEVGGDFYDFYFVDENHFVVDMSGLEYLSSAGIRVLIRLTKKAKTLGKDFAICAPDGVVKTVLIDSRMDMFVTIHKSTDELK